MKGSEKEKNIENLNQIKNLIQGADEKFKSIEDQNSLLFNINSIEDKEIIKSLKNYQKLNFSELEIDIQCLGFYIVGKIIEDPVFFGKLICSVEDESRTLINISFSYFPGELKKNLKKGCLIVVFDPEISLFLDGTKGVKVTKLDIHKILICSSVEKFKELLGVEFIQKEIRKEEIQVKLKLEKDMTIDQKISKFKDEGLEYFKNEKYYLAVEKFTNAIFLDKNNFTLLSNRAEVLLRIGNYKAAIDDCIRALEIEPDHMKSKFRIARCYEQLGDFDKSLKIYQELLLIHNKKKDEISLKILEDLNNRISQIKNKTDNSLGIFNYQSLFEEEKLNTTANYEFKHSNYLSKKVSFSYSENKGINLIANSLINRGELIMMDHPLVYIYHDKYAYHRTHPDDKIEFKNQDFNDIASLFDNYSDVYRYLSDNLKTKLKYDHYLEDDISTLYTSSSKNMDFEKRKSHYKSKNEEEKINFQLDICYSNSILTLRNYNEKYLNLCYGLYKNFSFINHDCQPNSFYFGIGPYLFVRAIKDIEPNQEITISYCEPKSFNERKSNLKKWDFTCECSLCKIESPVGDTKHYKFIETKLEKLRNYINSLNLKPEQIEKFTFDIKRDEKIFTQIKKWVQKIELIENSRTEYNYLHYVFFKNLSSITNSDLELSTSIFEKSIELSKKISSREIFDCLIQFYVILGYRLSNEKSSEILNSIESHFAGLFTDDIHCLKFILNYKLTI